MTSGLRNEGNLYVTGQGLPDRELYTFGGGGAPPTIFTGFPPATFYMRMLNKRIGRLEAHRIK